MVETITTTTTTTNATQQQQSSNSRRSLRRCYLLPYKTFCQIILSFVSIVVTVQYVHDHQSLTNNNYLRGVQQTQHLVEESWNTVSQEIHDQQQQQQQDSAATRTLLLEKQKSTGSSTDTATRRTTTGPVTLSSTTSTTPPTTPPLVPKWWKIQNTTNPSFHRPPLSTFINPTTNEIQNLDQIQQLLDFAIIGFPKSGTTTLGQMLSSVSSSTMNNENDNNVKVIGVEKETIVLNKPIREVIQNLQQRIPTTATSSTSNTNTSTTTTRLLLGNRCPGDIRRKETRRNLQRFFPTTKLIVTVRHPIQWLESFYNYRIDEGYFYKMKDGPNSLIGKVDTSNFWDLSTIKGEYHKYLAQFYKTPLQDPNELQLLQPFINSKLKEDVLFSKELLKIQQQQKQQQNGTVSSTIQQQDTNTEKIMKFPVQYTNPIFFLDMEQLGDTNVSRAKQFRYDLETYLGLPIHSLPSVVPHIRPNQEQLNSNPSAQLRKLKHINICHEEYKPVRNEMMRISIASSKWFRDYFLQSSDVYVSNREHLFHILETSWMIDPCDNKNEKEK